NKGKVAYMAPEQIKNLPSDRRVDIFALGVVLWESTIGKRLFKGKNDFATADRVKSARIPRPSELRPKYPKRLEEIVMCALERDPDSRFPTARSLGDELRAFLAREGAFISAPDLERFMRETFPSRHVERLEMVRKAASPSLPVL